MFKILPFDMKYISQSYEFLLETFQISFGSDKNQWPNRLGTYSFTAYKADIERLIKSNELLSYSVFDKEKLIGEIGLRLINDTCGYVNFYYLIPEYRNKGLGKHLDEFAIIELKRLGCQKMRLTVSELNKAGQRFYEKNGWKFAGPDLERPLGIFMEKDID